MADRTVHIRPAKPSDTNAILALVHDLAAYERAPDAVEMTVPMLETALFGETPFAHAIVADENLEILGFALYFTTFSTWTGKAGLYLADLFVRPECRGRGIGKSLLRYLAIGAIGRDFFRLQWQVENWNQVAIDFYKSFGAEPIDGSTGYLVKGQALAALANQETKNG